MKKYVLRISVILLLLLGGCAKESFPRCVPADAFGSQKFFVNALYTEGSSEYYANNGGNADGENYEQVVRWRDTGLITSEFGELVLRTQGYWTAWVKGNKKKTPGNYTGVSSALSKTSVNDVDISKDRLCGPLEIKDSPLSLGCGGDKQCVTFTNYQHDDFIAGNHGAPCWFTNGMGLYILLRRPGDPDPNETLDLMRYPVSPVFHMGYNGVQEKGQNSFLTMRHTIRDNSCAASIGDEEGKQIGEGWKIYVKILDQYYWNNSGGYFVEFLKGVDVSSPEVLEGVRKLVQSVLYDAMKHVFTSITDNPYYKKMILGMLTIFIAVSALLYLSGMINPQSIKGDFFTRIMKFAAVATLIAPGAWEFFFNNLFSLWWDGMNSVIGIMVSPILGNDGYNPQKPFANIDYLVQKVIFAKEVWEVKMRAIAVAYFWGVIALFIIIGTLLIFLYILFHGFLVYLLGIMAISLIIATFPILFVGILFERFKQLFNSWITQATSFTFQSIIIFVTLGIFANIIIAYYYRVFGFTACYNEVLKINLVIIKLKPFSDYTPGQIFKPATIGKHKESEATKALYARYGIGRTRKGWKKNLAFTGGAGIIPVPPRYDFYDFRYVDYPYLDPDKTSTRELYRIRVNGNGSNVRFVRFGIERARGAEYEDLMNALFYVRTAEENVYVARAVDRARKALKQEIENCREPARVAVGANNPRTGRACIYDTEGNIPDDIKLLYGSSISEIDEEAEEENCQSYNPVTVGAVSARTGKVCIYDETDVRWQTVERLVENAAGRASSVGFVGKDLIETAISILDGIQKDSGYEDISPLHEDETVDIALDRGNLHVMRKRNNVLDSKVKTDKHVEKTTADFGKEEVKSNDRIMAAVGHGGGEGQVCYISPDVKTSNSPSVVAGDFNNTLTEYQYKAIQYSGDMIGAGLLTEEDFAQRKEECGDNRQCIWNSGDLQRKATQFINETNNFQEEIVNATYQRMQDGFAKFNGRSLNPASCNKLRELHNHIQIANNDPRYGYSQRVHLIKEAHAIFYNASLDITYFEGDVFGDELAGYIHELEQSLGLVDDYRMLYDIAVKVTGGDYEVNAEENAIQSNLADPNVTPQGLDQNVANQSGANQSLTMQGRLGIMDAARVASFINSVGNITYVESRFSGGRKKEVDAKKGYDHITINEIELNGNIMGSVAFAELLAMLVTTFIMYNMREFVFQLGASLAGASPFASNLSSIKFLNTNDSNTIMGKINKYSSGKSGILKAPHFVMNLGTTYRSAVAGIPSKAARKTAGAVHFKEGSKMAKVFGADAGSKFLSKVNTAGNVLKSVGFTTRGHHREAKEYERIMRKTSASKAKMFIGGMVPTPGEVGPKESLKAANKYFGRGKEEGHWGLGRHFKEKIAREKEYARRSAKPYDNQVQTPAYDRGNKSKEEGGQLEHENLVNEVRGKLDHIREQLSYSNDIGSLENVQHSLSMLAGGVPDELWNEYKHMQDEIEQRMAEEQNRRQETNVVSDDEYQGATYDDQGGDPRGGDNSQYDSDTTPNDDTTYDDAKSDRHSHTAGDSHAPYYDEQEVSDNAQNSKSDGYKYNFSQEDDKQNLPNQHVTKQGGRESSGVTSGAKQKYGDGGGAIDADDAHSEESISQEPIEESGSAKENDEYNVADPYSIAPEDGNTLDNLANSGLTIHEDTAKDMGDGFYKMQAYQNLDETGDHVKQLNALIRDPDEKQGNPIEDLEKAGYQIVPDSTEDIGEGYYKMTVVKEFEIKDPSSPTGYSTIIEEFDVVMKKDDEQGVAESVMETLNSELGGLYDHSNDESVVEDTMESELDDLIAEDLDGIIDEEKDDEEKDDDEKDDDEDVENDHIEDVDHGSVYQSTTQDYKRGSGYPPVEGALIEKNKNKNDSSRKLKKKGQLDDNDDDLYDDDDLEDEILTNVDNDNNDDLILAALSQDVFDRLKEIKEAGDDEAKVADALKGFAESTTNYKRKLDNQSTSAEINEYAMSLKIDGAPIEEHIHSHFAQEGFGLLKDAGLAPLGNIFASVDELSERMNNEEDTTEDYDENNR